MNICCICETNRYSKKFNSADGYNLLKCSNCGLIYLNTIDAAIDPLKFLEDAKIDLFSEDKKVEYWSFPSMYEKYSFIFEEFFKKRLFRCLKFEKDINSMFDIGCGYGFWMNYCNRAGIKVRGIDISEEAIKYAKEILKLDVEVSSLATFNFSEKYDLYNCCDVMEHLEDPNRELKIIYNAMEPDSLLYLQVPDVLGIKISFGYNLGLPHHIWQFNFKTLKKLLNKNGFCVLKRWYGVQGVIGAYERKEVNAFTKLEWFFARNFNLGNRLMVLCRKDNV